MNALSLIFLKQSLISQIDSLFRFENSLFPGVGNLPEKHR